MASSSDGKLALSIPDSWVSRCASMTNSDGKACVIVPRGRPSRSLNIQVPAGLRSAGVTTTSTAASPSMPEILALGDQLSRDAPVGLTLPFSRYATTALPAGVTGLRSIDPGEL